ncbi:MAG: peptide deformylase [Bacilli bacterium]|nr:peptide deformylase [Bacilli bacterium]
MDKVKKMTIEDNEEFLRQVSKPVIFPDKELENNIKLLEQYFTESDTTLALAAVQIGIPKRLIYLKNTDLEIINRKNNDQETEEDKQHNERRILINPVIISREGLTEYWEACASCLDNLGKLKRPYKIVIRYQDINGQYHDEVFEGFESTVLSHEMDHLDGILHMDKAEELLVMTKEERKEFRKTHGYEIISQSGKYEDLLKDKKVLKKK